MNKINFGFLSFITIALAVVIPFFLLVATNINWIPVFFSLLLLSIIFLAIHTIRPANPAEFNTDQNSSKYTKKASILVLVVIIFVGVVYYIVINNL